MSDPVFVFTCISFGAIATTVEWMQDCQPVCGDGPPVLDLNALESSSRLTVMGNAGIVSCTVSNAKPSSKFAEMDCDSYKGIIMYSL